jgi:hypothetical protein
MKLAVAFFDASMLSNACPVQTWLGLHSYCCSREPMRKPGNKLRALTPLVVMVVSCQPLTGEQRCPQWVDKTLA